MNFALRGRYRRRQHSTCLRVLSTESDLQKQQSEQQQQVLESPGPPQYGDQSSAETYLASFDLPEGQAFTARVAAAAAAAAAAQVGNSYGNGNGNGQAISLAQQFLLGFEAGQDALKRQELQTQQQDQQPRLEPATNTAAQFLASISNPPSIEDQGPQASSAMQPLQQGQQGDVGQEGVAAGAAGAATDTEDEGDQGVPSGEVQQSPFCFAADEAQDDIDPEKILFAQTIQGGGSSRVFPYLRAEDAWAEFEKRLEADLQTVANTLLALFAVVCFWRGIWALLDHVFGDNPLGDFVCVLMGLGIIIYIRLTGLRIGSFWPSL